MIRCNDLEALAAREPKYVQIDGKNYRRVIMAPKRVRDGMSRCIACGQIDDEPWHDMTVCAEAHRIHWGALAAQEKETPNE